MKLTKAQKKKYMEENGKFCPFCHSNKIFMRPMDYSDKQFHCEYCSKTWEEIWKIVDIKTK